MLDTLAILQKHPASLPLKLGSLLLVLGASLCLAFYTLPPPSQLNTWFFVTPFSRRLVKLRATFIGIAICVILVPLQTTPWHVLLAWESMSYSETVKSACLCYECNNCFTFPSRIHKALLGLQLTGTHKLTCIHSWNCEVTNCIAVLVAYWKHTFLQLSGIA